MSAAPAADRLRGRTTGRRQPRRPSRRRSSGRRSEAGASAVELAVLAPGFLLLVFLTVQAALFFYGKTVAIQAAREGVSQLRLAQTQADYSRQQAAITDNTERYAATVGQQGLLAPAATPSYDDVAGRVRMEVTGGVITLVPGLQLRVRAHAEGQVERFEPTTGVGP